jgi:hypothetical protein
LLKGRAIIRATEIVLFAPLSETGNRQAPQKIYSTPVPARSDVL